MSILNSIFGKKPVDGAKFFDEVLGELVWDSKEKSWVGCYRNIEFSLGYEKNCTEPSQALLGYAQELLLDDGCLKQSLKNEIADLISKAPEILNVPEQLEELNSLFYESLHFSMRKGEGYTFGVLGPENKYRFWRIEFLGKKCVGLGFDS